MAWEEMIDGLTGSYPPEQFRVPFTTWRDIFRKIEEKFIIKKWSQYIFTNWLGNLKREIHIKTIPFQTLDKEISNLDSSSNYWVVIVFGNSQRDRHHVYDCHLNSMKVLVSRAPADFYIVDKRYDWLTYFKVDRDNNEVLLFKSGDSQTPFDRT
jgi:hypothetical protein